MGDKIVVRKRCYNKVNNKLCFFCCWGNTNNIFFYVYSWFR